jgi:ADP-ribosyl-[dinitrogen reductase] hydrolase
MSTVHTPTADTMRGPRERRRAGSLLGLAIGDALGAAVEFRQRGSFELVTGFRGGGSHGLAPGQWTDDTSMALALADSLALVGWDVEDQGRRYLAWWREGKYSVNGTCFDIGTITRAALARIERGAAARDNGDDADGASGNGSIMRLAPVPIYFLDLFPGRVGLLASYARQSSAPTHRSPKCLSACRYLAVVLAALMAGCKREDVLSPDWPVLRELDELEPLHPAILEVARGSYRRKPPSSIKGSGYVVESLEAALWAFHDASTFRDAVLAAVNLGQDADTTGAICGQLAGAYFGSDGIPEEWVAGVAQREWLEDAVGRLSRSPALRTETAAHAEPSYDIGRSIVQRTPAARALADATADAPTQRCYWVIPGRFLAGAYPGKQDRALHVAGLTSLWSAGVRTFVSLMEEHERNQAGEAFAEYDPAIRELAARDGEAARFERFPIVDVRIPSRAFMVATLDCIDAELAADRGVYVHCLGGIGRTGTVVGCWLRRHGLASRDEVASVIARLRQKDLQRASRQSPETSAQFQFVRDWTE